MLLSGSEKPAGGIPSTCGSPTCRPAGTPPHENDGHLRPLARSQGPRVSTRPDNQGFSGVAGSANSDCRLSEALDPGFSEACPHGSGGVTCPTCRWRPSTRAAATGASGSSSAARATTWAPTGPTGPGAPPSSRCHAGDPGGAWRRGARCRRPPATMSGLTTSSSMPAKIRSSRGASPWSTSGPAKHSHRRGRQHPLRSRHRSPGEADERSRRAPLPALRQRTRVRLVGHPAPAHRGPRPWRPSRAGGSISTRSGRTRAWPTSRRTSSGSSRSSQQAPTWERHFSSFPWSEESRQVRSMLSGPAARAVALPPGQGLVTTGQRAILPLEGDHRACPTP